MSEDTSRQNPKNNQTIYQKSELNSAKQSEKANLTMNNSARKFLFHFVNTLGLKKLFFNLDGTPNMGMILLFFFAVMMGSFLDKIELDMTKLVPQAPIGVPGNAFTKTLPNDKSTETPIKHEIKNFEEVCNFPIIMARAFVNRGRSFDNSSKIEVAAKSTNTDSLWPVFSWRCKYTQVVREPLDGQPSKETFETGIGNLTEDYCQPKYGLQYKAAYESAHDPTSWYCAILNPQGKTVKTNGLI